MVYIKRNIRDEGNDRILSIQIKCHRHVPRSKHLCYRIGQLFYVPPFTVAITVEWSIFAVTKCDIHASKLSDYNRKCFDKINLLATICGVLFQMHGRWHFVLSLIARTVVGLVWAVSFNFNSEIVQALCTAYALYRNTSWNIFMFLFHIILM